MAGNLDISHTASLLEADSRAPTGRMVKIEMENFKSFKGRHEIPFTNFTAIIGPNGSGKSNLMDAISFVLGEKSAMLRVKTVKDLIHGTPVGCPVSNRAHVTMTFEESDGNQLVFTRVVTGSSSDYRVNGKSCSQADYQKELERIGILIKARNFLVFQGQVESIAMKNPKERTALLEEISKSGELIEEYEKRKTEQFRAEEETKDSFLKKKEAKKVRNEAKMEKDEADKYNDLKVDLSDAQIEVMLFKLYHNQRDVDQVLKEIQDKQKDLDKTMGKKNKTDEEMKAIKKEAGKIWREIGQLENDIRLKEGELNKKKPVFIKAKEKTAHLVKKLENTKKSLKNSEKANAEHQKEIAKLEQQLQDVEQARLDYEEAAIQESQSQGRDIALEESQVKEYNKLKEKVAKQVPYRLIRLF